MPWAYGYGAIEILSIIIIIIIIIIKCTSEDLIFYWFRHEYRDYIHFNVVKPGEMTIDYNAQLLPFIAAAFCLVRMRVIKRLFFMCQKAVNNF